MTETVFWILTVLSSESRHGYAILTSVGELSEGAVALRVTTLYASLERLERDGRIHVVGEEVVDGRARRYYDITDEGRTELAAEAERLAQRAAVAQASIAARTPPARAATVSTVTA
ncbi:Transcriptional regulator, PadR family [Leifsonia rubra CMS 76R]|nr:Transcriptional regulator, PadR family [Leifsonia rubra CMS 76R]